MVYYTHKPFCCWQVVTKENPEGTDCIAHGVKGQIFKCPYASEDIKYDSEGVYISNQMSGMGECDDFKFLPELKKNAVEPIQFGRRAKKLQEIVSY